MTVVIDYPSIGGPTAFGQAQRSQTMAHDSIGSTLSTLNIDAIHFHQACNVEERLIIVHPTSQSVTFAWSDFPIICECQETENKNTMKIQRATQSPKVSRRCTPQPKDTENKRATNKKSEKRVTFGNTVQIREYTIIYGDHPWCPLYPLALGWDYNLREEDLEKYEKQKSIFRRHGNQLRLDLYERKNLLRNVAGYTENELLNFLHEQKHGGKRSFGFHHVATVHRLLSEAA